MDQCIGSPSGQLSADKVPESALSQMTVSTDPVVPLLKDSGLFHCPQCDQGFKQRSNAQSHFKSVHLNLKSKCPQCGKHFKKLKAHIQDVHSEKKIIKCKICGKGYPEGRLIKDHLNKTHFRDENGNPHHKYLITTECEVCGKFMLKSRLERHMRMKHYLPPNYVVECPLCGAHVKYLPWHLQKFHKDVDYSRTMKKCDQCEKWFLKNEDLKNHLVDHEKYFCYDCYVNFDSHLKLAKHMFTKHKKVFNIGKTSKIMKKTSNKTITYHVDKLPGRSNSSLVQTQEHVEDKVNDSQGINMQGKIPVDSELFETLEEESFTVVLDEEGNLQNVILDKEQELNKKIIISDKESKIDYKIHVPLNMLNQTQESLKHYSYDGFLPLKEGLTDLSDSILAGRTEPFSFLLPPENPKACEDLSSESICVLIENEPETDFNSRDSIKDSGNTSKLHERFISTKSSLPRSLIGVDLSPEDEAVLKGAPRLEELTSKDLHKYQIGKNERNGSSKFNACPSRQAHLCPYCRKVLKTRHSLSMHISVVHLAEKKIGCEVCDKTFPTKADLVKHNKASHESSGTELVKCDICDQSFKASYMRRHKYYKHTSNSLPKHCGECGKEFKSREIMLKHVRKIHTNDIK